MANESPSALEKDRLPLTQTKPDTFAFLRNRPLRVSCHNGPVLEQRLPAPSITFATLSTRAPASPRRCAMSLAFCFAPFEGFDVGIVVHAWVS
jgi:hypothetical protein